MAEKKTTKITKTESIKPVSVDSKVIELANNGFNVNQIASMLALHSHIVKEILERS